MATPTGPATGPPWKKTLVFPVAGFTCRIVVPAPAVPFLSPNSATSRFPAVSLPMVSGTMAIPNGSRSPFGAMTEATVLSGAAPIPPVVAAP